MNYWAVVPAAGVGRRMQAGLPKQYLLLNGRRVIDWTLEVLLAEPRIRGVYVALGAEDPFWESCEHAGHPRVRRVAGGEERAHSVLSALLALETEAAPADRVLVHDAARPCLRPEDLSKLLELASGEAGGLLAMPVRDTMKRADAEGRSETTLDRSRIWHAFTPQLRNLYAGAILEHGRIERVERNPLWTFILVATGDRKPDLLGALWTLRSWPLDLVTWDIRNSHRLDIQRLPPNFRPG